MTDELQTEPADNHSNSMVIRKKFTFAKFSLVFVGLFMLSVVVCEVLGWPFLKEPVERFATKQLERTVKIDEPFKLKLLGGVKLEVGGLFISAPKEFDTPHFIETKNIALNLRYSDLLKFKSSNQLRIKSLSVNQIDAQLLRREDGSATWQFSDDKTKPDSPFPIIETLIVQNGVAKITDPQTQVDLVAKFHTDEGLSNKVASSSIDIEGKLLKKSIKGKLITDGFLPIATNDSDSSPITSKAWLEYSALRADFAGTVSDLLGKHNVKGKLSVKGPSLSVLGNLVNVVLPTTDKFSLNTLLENDGEVWIANAVSAHIGKSDLDGNFNYDPRPARPLLKGNISGKRFFLADLAPAFGTKNADGSVATPGNGKVLPDRPLDFETVRRRVQSAAPVEGPSRPVTPG